MTTSSSPVAMGAVRAAWDQACVLRSADDPGTWPDLSRRIAAAARTHGTRELLRGTVLLIGCALAQVGAGEPTGQHIAGEFTEVLMGRLDRWVEADFVDPGDLPTVRRVVDVVFAGGDPVAWRNGARPASAGEPRAMSCALALIADFVDVVDRPGACERTLLRALGDTLD